MSARAAARWLIVSCALSLGACTLAQGYPDLGDELCDNGIDDDLNGQIDCDDRACNDVAPCAPRFGWTDAEGPPVAPPSLPCPDGWRVVSADGVDTCDPYPATGAASCAPGSAHFPGEPGCRLVGRACPSGTWPDDLPASNVWYVNPGPSGDGSRAYPFGDLQSALNAAAPTNGTVALAQGSYTLNSITQHVHVRGACATGTHLSLQPTAASGSALVVTGGPAVLEDLSIDGGGIGLVITASTTLRGVRVTSPPWQFGVFASGALTLELDDVVVEHVGTAMVGAGVTESYGVVAQLGAIVRMHDVVIADVTGIGLAMLSGDATLAAQDVAVRDIHLAPVGDGYGIWTVVPATLDRVVVERTSWAGLVLSANATLSDVVVRDVASSPVGVGAGIRATDSSVIAAERVSIERAHGSGILVQSPSRASFEDLVVRDTLPGAGAFGRGIDSTGASVDVRRALVVRSAEHGIVAGDVGHLHLEDVVVRDAGAGGIVCARSGAIDLSRGIVQGCGLVGIGAIGRGATFVVEDVLVRDTIAAADGTLGYGLLVQDRAFGQADHAVVEGSGSIGALMLGTRATLVAADLVVRATHASRCGPGCASGVGIGSFEGGELSLVRFLVDDASACGLALASSGSLQTQAGTIRGTPVGSCIDGASGIRATLEASIVYVGDGSALGPAAGTTPGSLPAPAPLVAHH